MSAETPWPCPIPLEIGPGRSPGGMVAVVWCPLEGEVSLVILGSNPGTEADQQQGRDHADMAQARIDRGLPVPWVVLYDGDTGDVVYMARSDYVHPTNQSMEWVGP